MADSRTLDSESKGQKKQKTLKQKHNESFEELIENAKAIITQLSQSNLNLKEGLELYKNGVTMLHRAQELLESAKLEFEELQDKETNGNSAIPH